MDVQTIMNELKTMATPSTRATMLRHGAVEPIDGVRIGDLKKLVKQVKGNQSLALSLYASTNSDAMYLAGLAIDPKKMTVDQLDDWALHSRWEMHAETTVPLVAAESMHGKEMAKRWLASENPLVMSSGWCTYGFVVMMEADETLDMDEIDQLLDVIVATIHTQPNRVKYCMNSFLMCVGGFVLARRERAKEAANMVGLVSVDMGNTACQVLDAHASIVAIEGRSPVVKKRKKARC